jgi:hypothetical protein
VEIIEAAHQSFATRRAKHFNSPADMPVVAAFMRGWPDVSIIDGPVGRAKTIMALMIGHGG